VYGLPLEKLFAAIIDKTNKDEFMKNKPLIKRSAAFLMH